MTRRWRGGHCYRAIVAGREAGSRKSWQTLAHEAHQIALRATDVHNMFNHPVPTHDSSLTLERADADSDPTYW